MYNYGARKVALIGLLDVGCIPRELAHSNGTCNSSINSVVDLFNAKLPSLVDSFNKNLYGAKFMFVNISAISNDIERNLQAYGIISNSLIFFNSGFRLTTVIFRLSLVDISQLD